MDNLLLLHILIVKVAYRHKSDIVIEYSSIESQPTSVFEQITSRLVQTNEMVLNNNISTSMYQLKQTTKLLPILVRFHIFTS